MRDDWVEVPYKNIVDKISTTRQKLKQKEYLQEGKIAIVDQGQELIGGYTNDNSKILNCNLPVIVFGDHTKIVKTITFPFAPGADGTKVLQPKNNIDVQLLANFTKILVHKISDKGYARHYQHIEKQNIPLPPLPEQRAIVAKIEELFRSLDNGISDLNKASAQLKIYRQAVLKKAFTGELSKEWRAKQANLPTAGELLQQIQTERQNHHQQLLTKWQEAVQLWQDDGKEGKKPRKPQALKKNETSQAVSCSELQEIPSGWVYLNAESISHFITKGTTPKKSDLFQNQGDVPFLKVYNLTFNGKIDFSINPTFVKQNTHLDFLKRSVVYPNDVLMNIVGPPLGKVSIAPNSHPEWNINQAIVRFRPYSILESNYLANFLLANFTIHHISKKAKATAGQFNLTLEICREIEIPICSHPEQLQIVQEIESRLSVCDNIEQSISASPSSKKPLQVNCSAPQLWKIAVRNQTGNPPANCSNKLRRRISND